MPNAPIHPPGGKSSLVAAALIAAGAAASLAAAGWLTRWDPAWMAAAALGAATVGFAVA